MKVSIKDIILKFKTVADNHPNLNSFGCGTLSELQANDTAYPYLWIVFEDPSNLQATDNKNYNVIDYSFTIRICDKKNLTNETIENGINGFGQSNVLDILSTTFEYVVDVVNAIQNAPDFDGISLLGDAAIYGLFDEDDGSSYGNETSIQLRVKNDDGCASYIFL